jgi:hypothetical protein
LGRADRRARRHATRVITLRSVKNRQAATAGPRPGYSPLPTARARWLRARLSTARTRILDVLIDQPAPCTVSALSALTRQHPNTIREHLDGLADERLAVRTRAPAVGRGRAWLFSAAPEVGFEPGAQGYAGLASALAAHIARTSPADSIEAGLLWGRGPDPEGTERTSLQALSEPGACLLDLLPRRGTPS